jgi:hypothetical protein
MTIITACQEKTSMVSPDLSRFQMETIKHELNEMRVYQWPEVEAFCHIFYLPPILPEGGCESIRLFCTLNVVADNGLP